MPDNPIDLMRGVAGPSQGQGALLINNSAVIHFCKLEGVRLCVETVDDSVRLKGEVEATVDKWGNVVRLWRAFTRHDITYLDPNDPGISEMKSNWVVPEAVHASLSDQLSDDCSDIRRLSTLAITRCFVYVDISDFSQQRAGQQALIVGSLISMVRNWKYWNRLVALDAWQALEAMICIGDGYIFVFKDAALAVYFAAHLAELIEARVARKLVPVEFHFRMGVHVGPVYFFWDWGGGGREEPKTKTWIERDGKMERTEIGDWNYIGEGINGGQRVLAAVGKETDDTLYISGQVRQELKKREDSSHDIRKIVNSLINRGRREDKHKKFWRVYEVNHSALCGNMLPPEALME
jgi:hypothetical protein